MTSIALQKTRLVGANVVIQHAKRDLFARSRLNRSPRSATVNVDFAVALPTSMRLGHDLSQKKHWTPQRFQRTMQGPGATCF
jgi:hypothetical protein